MMTKFRHVGHGNYPKALDWLYTCGLHQADEKILLPQEEFLAAPSAILGEVEVPYWQIPRIWSRLHE